jgi:glycosyltransferase involved in cell wall biosynthesis
MICVSQYICDRHVDAEAVPRELTAVIRLGADPGTSRIRRLDGAEVRLGFIGSLGHHKGILTVLEAFRRVPSQWRLLIAGTGPLAADVEREASLDHRISYLGHVSGEQKDAFFDALDLVVIPSEWEEPATFVAVEAAVRGLPAVVSDRGGLPETPEARTFRARDADDLVRAIRWFLDEPGRLEQHSRRLLADQHRFLWSTQMGRVEHLLEEVLVQRAIARGPARLED